MFLIERKFVRHLVRLSPSRTRIPPATGILRAMPRLKPVNRPLRYLNNSGPMIVSKCLSHEKGSSGIQSHPLLGLVEEEANDTWVASDCSDLDSFHPDLFVDKHGRFRLSHDMYKPYIRPGASKALSIRRKETLYDRVVKDPKSREPTTFDWYIDTTIKQNESKKLGKPVEHPSFRCGVAKHINQRALANTFLGTVQFVHHSILQGTCYKTDKEKLVNLLEEGALATRFLHLEPRQAITFCQMIHRVALLAEIPVEDLAVAAKFAVSAFEESIANAGFKKGGVAAGGLWINPDKLSARDVVDSLEMLASMAKFPGLHPRAPVALVIALEHWKKVSEANGGLSPAQHRRIFLARHMPGANNILPFSW